MPLVPNIKTVLTRHWSSWVYYALGILALIPEVLGYIGTSIDIPPLLVLALVVIGLGAKIVKQELPEQKEEANGETENE